MTQNIYLSQRCFNTTKRIVSGVNSDRKVAMVSEIDASKLQEFQREYASKYKTKPSYSTLLVKAIAYSLEKHPHANRLEVGFPFFKKMKQLEGSDINIAVERSHAGEEMLAFITTIYDAKDKSPADIQSELNLLSDDKIDNDHRWSQFNFIVTKLPTFISVLLLSIANLSEKLWVKYRGGSILISSPCKYGVDTLVGHWPSPIGFSFGLVKDRVIAVDGSPCVRPTMNITMSFDRCFMAGAPAARFFNDVVNSLENVSFRSISKSKTVEPLIALVQ